MLHLPPWSRPWWPPEVPVFHDVNGDILHTRAELLAHGVALDDDFRTGLALALRERYPAMYKDFRHWCHVQRPKPGELFTWASHGVRIANLLTQDPPAELGEHPGKAKLVYVHRALKALRKFVEKEGIRSVALPRLATGVGGLEWSEVEPELRRVFEGAPVDLYVYTVFRPGMSAVEPGLPVAAPERREARA